MNILTTATKVHTAGGGGGANSLVDQIAVTTGRCQEPHRLHCWWWTVLVEFEVEVVVVVQEDI